MSHEIAKKLECVENELAKLTRENKHLPKCPRYNTIIRTDPTEEEVWTLQYAVENKHLKERLEFMLFKLNIPITSFAGQTILKQVTEIGIEKYRHATANDDNDDTDDLHLLVKMGPNSSTIETLFKRSRRFSDKWSYRRWCKLLSRKSCATDAKFAKYFGTDLQGVYNEQCQQDRNKYDEMKYTVIFWLHELLRLYHYYDSLCNIFVPKYRTKVLRCTCQTELMLQYGAAVPYKS